MKLWAMPCRDTTTDGIVQGSDKRWSTGEGNGKSLQYTSGENSLNCIKRQKMWHWKMNPQVRRCPKCYWARAEDNYNSFKKNEAAGPKQKWRSFVDVSSDESKIRCCKEQYCIGTWNIRSMNQDKSDVVKKEMARVNILGINKLKWTRMGEFNSDDHYIYYCG